MSEENIIPRVHLSEIELSNSFIKDTLEEKNPEWLESNEYGDSIMKSVEGLIESEEITIARNGIIAAVTNDFITISVSPKNTFQLKNSVNVAIRILESIGDHDAIDCILSKVSKDLISHNKVIVSPAHIVHAFCTIKGKVSIVSGFVEKANSYIAINKESNLFYALIHSFVFGNEYIISDGDVHKYQTYEETTMINSLLIRYSIFYDSDVKDNRPMRIASSMYQEIPIINDLINMGVISSLGIPIADIASTFNSLEVATKNDKAIALYFDNMDNIVAYRNLDNISRIISNIDGTNAVKFSKIGLFILHGAQKKIDQAENAIMKSLSSGVQKEITTYSVDLLSKVCEYLTETFKARLSSIPINFNDPIETMKFITNILYKKPPNDTQLSFANSAIFGSKFDTDNQSRIYFLTTPPGSGKTACEILPAVHERFRNLDSKIGEERGITIISTSLVQVSAQIATNASKIMYGKEKWIRIKRLDSGIKEESKNDYHQNLLFRKNAFKESIVDSKWLYDNIIGNHDIQQIIKEIMEKFHIGDNSQIENEIKSFFEDEKLFKKNVISNIFDGFNSQGKNIADCIVGTYEMVVSALSYSLMIGNSHELIKKIKYIVIDEWDTIFRVATMNDEKKTLIQTMNQRFSTSYALIALAILIMRVNPSTKLILASGTGSDMLSQCEKNYEADVQSNMLEPLLRPIFSFGEYESILKKIEELSNNSNNENAKLTKNILINKIKKIENIMAEKISRVIKISPDNIWGTRKLSSIPRSTLRSVTKIHSTSNFLFCERCTNDGIIRASYAMKSSNTNDHVLNTIMHLCSMLLIDMNIAKTIKNLKQNPSMNSWTFLISTIICILTRRAPAISNKITLIFIQKKELHIGMLILIGIIILILGKYNKFDYDAYSIRAPPNDDFLDTIAAISSKPIKTISKYASIASQNKIYSINHIIDKCSITKEDYVKIKLITSIDEVDFVAYAITIDLLKAFFEIDHIWNVCELSIKNGIISVTRETTSQSNMNNYIANRDVKRFQLIAICISKLGEGVDLSNVGPVFVLAQNQSYNTPSNRDCEQWIGRGFRNSYLSLGCPINQPYYDDHRNFCADNQNKFIISHTAVYNGFLSTQIARRIVSIDAFSQIIKKDNNQFNLVDFLPKAFSNMTISYYSPIILENLQNIDGSPLLESIKSAIEMLTIPAKMVIRKTNMFSLNLRDITQNVPDLIATDTLNISCNVWPIFISSMFMALV